MNTCPKCDSDNIETRHVPKYRYRESGLENVWLEGNGVIEVVCHACRQRLVAVLKEQQLLQVIALGLLMRPGFLRGSEIRYLRKASRLTQEELAKRLHLDRRTTITEWEGQDEPKRDEAWEYSLRAALLAGFDEALSEDRNSHLTKSHLQVLADFKAHFASAYRDFFTRRAKRTLRLMKRRDWQPFEPTRKAA